MGEDCIKFTAYFCVSPQSNSFFGITPDLSFDHCAHHLYKYQNKTKTHSMVIMDNLTGFISLATSRSYYKDAVHKRVKIWSQQKLISVSCYLSLMIPASLANKIMKSCSRLLSKFPPPASFFSSHPEYHHKKQPNPASCQTYYGPSY